MSDYNRGWTDTAADKAVNRGVPIYSSRRYDRAAQGSIGRYALTGVVAAAMFVYRPGLVAAALLGYGLGLLAKSDHHGDRRLHEASLAADPA